MKAVYKEPMKAPEIIDVGNSLTALQHKVQGYIECVTLTEHAVLICNEEGLINDMHFNIRLCGMQLFGPILIVGRDGDEFCDCPYPEWCLDTLREGK